MCSAKRSPRRMRTLALLACAAGILVSSFTGCTGGGTADLSPEAQAKAKQAFKKKSENYGRTGNKASR
jgi:hypothetical protein